LIIIFVDIVRQEVVQVIVRDYNRTYCSVNSSLRKRAWLATVGCGAFLTTMSSIRKNFPWGKFNNRKYPAVGMSRLTDTNNRCEPLHHRNKEKAYGYW